MLVTNEDNIAIFFTKDDTIENTRYTTAYILAKCCLGKETYTKDYLNYKFRSENNETIEDFAAELLIPLEKLHDVYLNMALPNTRDLANKFLVPINIMEHRLNRLKISHYNVEMAAITYKD